MCSLAAPGPGDPDITDYCLPVELLAHDIDDDSDDHDDDDDDDADNMPRVHCGIQASNDDDKA